MGYWPRLRVVPLSLSLSCVTRKKTARKKWPLEILGGEERAGFLAAIFFLAVFFRVTHDRLSERGTTRSLLLTKLVRSKWLDIGQAIFFCVKFMDRAGVEVYKLVVKRTVPISSYLDRTPSTSLVNKRFLIRLSGKFFIRDTAGNPERARLRHLVPVGVANNSASHKIIEIIRVKEGCVSHHASGYYSNWRHTRKIKSTGSTSCFELV